MNAGVNRQHPRDQACAAQKGFAAPQRFPSSNLPSTTANLPLHIRQQNERPVEEELQPPLKLKHDKCHHRKKGLSTTYHHVWA